MKLLIELPTWLGDCVMATPAIENIIHNFPECKIIFIGSEISIELMKDHPKYLSSMILERSILNLYSQVKQIGAVDIFFSFRSSKRTRLLSFLLNSKKKFHYKKTLFKAGHQVERYNNFVNKSLSINRKPKSLVIYGANQKDEKSRPILGINPGAAYGSAKCWSHKKYAEVANSLSNKFDIVILGGNKEVDLAREIEENLIRNNCSNFTNYAGKTTIRDLINLISSIDMLITGDSGPMHIAAAFEIPTVSIFGPTKDNQTRQWMNPKSTVIKKELECQPCMKRVCPLKHHNCMVKIASREVIESALGLI